MPAERCDLIVALIDGALTDNELWLATVDDGRHAGQPDAAAVGGEPAPASIAA